MSGKWVRRCVIVLLFAFIVSFFRTSLADTQNLAVSATVPAHTSDFPVTLTQSTPGNQFPQDKELSYTVTYGSDLSGTTDLTLVASWSRGTIAGDPTPSLDIVEYVPGSASNANNSTPPVVDTVNRTITWTMTAFPATTTNATVTFHLKTNHSYTGTSTVAFTVNAQSHGAGADSTISTVSDTYLYDPSLNPTATPTITPTPTQTPAGIGPSATPGPGPSATPTPTPVLSASHGFRFTNITPETISPTSASVRVETSENSSVALSYGIGIHSLGQEVNDPSRVSSRLLQLNNLKESTSYFFKIVAKNASGQTVTSDVYTFKTGQTGASPEIDRARTIITSEHILLYPTSGQVFVIPANANYELNLIFLNPETVKQVTLLVQSQVLGANTITPKRMANTLSGQMSEISPGKYVVRLTSGLRAGRYQMVTRIADSGGNITNVTIGTLKVIDPLTVLDKSTHNPVERAKVRLSLYNYRTHSYEFISPSALAIANPSYTLEDGTDSIVLPQGLYQAEVTTMIAKTTTVKFTIGPGDKENFPVVYLEHDPFSIIPFLKYQWETCMEAFGSVHDLMVHLAQSLRLFELNAYVILAFFVLITFYSFSKRIKIPIRSFKEHYSHKLRGSYYSTSAPNHLTGQITESDGKKGIPDADVFLINPRTASIASHTKSKHDGMFAFPIYKEQQYVFEVMKDGFAPNRFHEDHLEKTDTGYILRLKPKPSSQSALHALLINLIASGFESMLFTSLSLETLFLFVFGFAKTAPFIALSVFNLVLVILQTLHEQE